MKNLNMRALLQKNQNCWNSDLKPRLIRICRIRWQSSFFSSLDRNSRVGIKVREKYLNRHHPLWANLLQNIKIVCLSWNLVSRLVGICRIQWWCSFYVLAWKYPFYKTLVRKIKIVSLIWNSVQSLIQISRIWRWSSFFFFFWETRNSLV